MTAYATTDVLRAAATVITARGYYQPLSRQWESLRPTVMDVEALLNGHRLERGDATAYARARAATPHVPEAVRQWCTAGAHGATEYRAKLARLAAQTHITDRDIPLLASAVDRWQRDQQRTARAHQAAADAAASHHQGQPKQPFTAHVTVAASVPQSRTYGARTQNSSLIKLRDQTGNIFVWPTTIEASRLPAEGDSIQITGTVTKHTASRNGVAQTYLTRCKWRPAEAN
jgi:hypothetical protein